MVQRSEFARLRRRGLLINHESEMGEVSEVKRNSDAIDAA
jgi:hypothetical protein